MKDPGDDIAYIPLERDLVSKIPAAASGMYCVYDRSRTVIEAGSGVLRTLLLDAIDRNESGRAAYFSAAPFASSRGAFSDTVGPPLIESDLKG